MVRVKELVANWKELQSSDKFLYILTGISFIAAMMAIALGGATR